MNFRLSIILSTICVNCFNFVYSQETNLFKAGIRGAYNYTQMLSKDVKDDPATKLIPSFGYNLGADIVYNFQKKLAIAADFLYAVHNQTFERNAGSYSIINKQFTYLDIDILLQYITETKVGFYLEAGPQFSKLFKATDDYNTPANKTDDLDITPLYENFLYGILFGTGIEITLPKNLYLISGLRFVYSFKDMIDQTKRNSDSIFTSYRYFTPVNRIYGGIILGIRYHFKYQSGHFKKR